MPASNPKLQVILPKDVMATISALAKLQNRSRSAVARDFLVEVAPVLARVANTLQAAANMDQAGRARLLANLEAVQDAVEGLPGQLTLKLDRAIATAERRPASGAKSKRQQLDLRRRASRRRTAKPPYQ